MRQKVQKSRILKIFEELAKRCKGPGRIYVTGGSTAVLMGWRDITQDVDMKLGPEPAGIFEAIRDLKDELDVNFELASPGDFIPQVPGWESRSRFIDAYNRVEFFHYDFYSQALSKIQRGHERDLIDVRAMLREGLIESQELKRLFKLIEPNLIRFPSLSVEDFNRKMEAIVGPIS